MAKQELTRMEKTPLIQGAYWKCVGRKSDSMEGSPLTLVGSNLEDCSSCLAVLPWHVLPHLEKHSLCGKFPLLRGAYVTWFLSELCGMSSVLGAAGTIVKGTRRLGQVLRD
ncbi:hypothetical protein MPTK2_1g19630 [Marchantia polymorpha subsp. ruderalis]